MNDHRQALDEGKLLGEDGVEEDRKSCDGYGQEGTVPVLGHIGVRVVEHDEPLDHGPTQVCARGAVGLPAKDTDPADDVAQGLLMFPRRKFGNPVVLAATRRSPASKSKEME